MTGTRFVTNPLPGAAAPYDRLYKTGRLVPQLTSAANCCPAAACSNDVRVICYIACSLQLHIMVRLLRSSDEHLYVCRQNMLRSPKFLYQQRAYSVLVHLITACSFEAACSLDAAEECLLAINDVICMLAGDLARWLEDGTIQILGRIDRQVMSTIILLCSLVMLGLGIFCYQT